MKKRVDLNNSGAVGVLEIILVALVVGTITFVVLGLYKAKHKLNSVSSTQVQTAPKNQSATADQTPLDDKAEALAAIKSDCEAEVKGQTCTVTLTRSATNFVQATAGTNAVASGHSVVAKKIDGTWQVIYKGQEAPGKDWGAKYSAPADWYVTDY